MNQITEIALFTNDVERLARFYERLLGVPPAAQSSNMAGFRIGVLQLLLHHKYPPDPQYASGPDQLPNEDHVALGVAQVDSMCATLVEQGVTIDFAPRDYPWGRSAYLRDPDGRLIELEES